MSNCSNVSLEQMQKTIDCLNGNIDNFSDRGLLTLRMFHHMPPRIRTYFGHYLQGNGLNETAWYALMVIFASPRQQTTPSQLSAILDLTRTSGTRLSDELVDKGWIVRKNCDQDRRQVILNLTASGTKLIHQTVPMLSQARSKIFDNFTDQELDTLDELMRKMLNNVDELNQSIGANHA